MESLEVWAGEGKKEKQLLKWLFYGQKTMKKYDDDDDDAKCCVVFANGCPSSSKIPPLAVFHS